MIGKNPFELGKRTLIWHWEWGLISAHESHRKRPDLSCLKVTFYPSTKAHVAIKDDWGMSGKALAKVEPHPTRGKLLTKLQIQ